MRRKWRTMGLRASVMVGSALLPVVSSIGVQAAAHAAGSAPQWEADPQSASYGQVVFYDANGNMVTSGTDYNNPFAWAVGATHSDVNVNQGNLITALPQQGVLTANWATNLDNSSPLPPTGAPSDITALAATNPVVAGGTAASILNFNVKYPTTSVAGYQDVVQFRVTDSGVRGAGNATSGTYWSSDVAFNPTTASITVLGVTVPPSGWAQVFPVVNPTSTTSLTTSATGGNLNIGQSLTLTATVTPAGGATGAGSVNFFENTGSGPTLLGSGPVNSSGVATYSYTPGGGSQSYTATFVPTLGDIQSPDTARATMTSESTSSPVVVSVTAPSTTTTVSSPGSVVVGTPVTYTATVTSGGGTPNGGTVNFMDGGTTITSCGSQSVSAGSATCQTTPTSAGTHSITASYSPGTAPFAGSTSPTYSQAVLLGTVSTNLTANPDPGGAGQTVTLTATLAVTAGAGTPTGTVQFENGGTAITTPNSCSAVALTSLTATCTTTFASGTYNLSAVYSGDSNFTTSTGTTSEPVYPATTTAVGSSGATSVVGQSVTYTATVTSTSTVNAGTVSFTDGGSPVAGCSGGSAPAVSSGTASCTTTPVGLGIHSIVATYLPGTAPFGGSVSSAFTQTVNQAATTTTLSPLPTPDPSVTGQTVTYSAQVTVTAPGAGAPTGSVTFSAGGTLLCTATLNGSGAATCTNSSLTAAGGPYILSASYQGDTNFAGSVSSPNPQVVNPATTSLTLTSSTGSSPSYTGQTVTYQAKLSVGAPGLGQPTGAVVFKDGTTTLCSDALGAGLTVVCNETPSSAGSLAITASYAGDGNFAAATTASLTQVVQIPTAPGAPTAVAATAGDTKVGLSWTAPASNGGSTVLGYNVYVGTSAGGESSTPANSAPITGTSYTVTGLTNATRYYFTVEAVNAVGLSAPSNEVAVAPVNSAGYLIVGRDGGVFTFGGASYHGSLGGVPLLQPIVSVAATPDKGGYWMVAADGGVFTFGDATFYGSLGKVHLTKPIVTIIPTHDGKGYWLVASDGGIFTFGDAVFHGSLGNVHLAQPIVTGMVTPSGGGYWLIARDGGVFTFGDAVFHGSLGNVHLSQPIVGAAATTDGGGYWMVAGDGGMFTFGDAVFHGSLGNVHLAQPIVALAPTSDGGGYWLIAADGGVFTFGDAQYRGSVPGTGTSVNNVIGAA